MKINHTNKIITACGYELPMVQNYVEKVLGNPKGWKLIIKTHDRGTDSKTKGVQKGVPSEK